MKKNKVPGILYAISLIFILLIPGSCKKDPSLMPYDSLLMDINRFIWKGLNYNYLWYKDSYNLTDTRFSDNSERDDFLSDFSDPEALFYSLLHDYGSVDRFSWIVDDYVALEEYFQGISLSMGFKYKILYYSGNNVIGSVLYVVDGSPADNAGIKRGDLFSHINGNRLTGSNYASLLDNYSYTLTIAEIDGDLVNTLKNVSLTVAEVVENPVYFSNIYTINDKKTGYLFYKGFRRNYEEDLNNVFGYFASEGIDELVLDLRYNGGGYVSTCARLGSMIYEADTNKIFCIKEYNDKYGQWLVDEYGPDAKNFNFYYSVFQEDNSIIPINSLGLDNIYVLTTGSSASASELLINCLRAYIDVTIIGTKTYGKNVGSITVYDTDDDGNINPDHLWAMQPIVSKSYNVNYSSPYSNGFDPDYLLEEDYLKLLPIGDENEAMLKYALDLIAGTPVDNKAAYSHNYNIIADSQDKDPYWSEMIVDPGK